MLCSSLAYKSEIHTAKPLHPHVFDKQANGGRSAPPVRIDKIGRIIHNYLASIGHPMMIP